MSDSSQVNPLLEQSFRVPFDRIRAENISPAISELLSSARSRVD